MIYKDYLSSLYQAVRIPIVLYSNDGKEILLSLIPRSFKSLESLENIHKNFLSKYQNSFNQNLNLTSSQEPLLLKLPDQNIVVIGPVDLENKNDLKVNHLIIKSINMWLGLVKSLLELEVVPQNEKIDLKELEKLDDEFLKNVTASDYLLGPHNQYRYEAGLLDAIASGDIERYKRAIDAPLMGRIGKLADDELTSLKCHANLLNTLASRVAIKVGIPYEIAFTLSDKYFMAVSRVQSCDEAWSLRRLVGLAFTKLIAQYNKKNHLSENMWVSRAKFELCRYIFSELDLDKVVENVGCSYANLQKTFRKNTQQTMTQYLKEQRLITSCELLKSTTNSIADIASMLMFANQGHYCREFKKLYGLTPSEFRLYKKQGSIK